MPPTRSRRATMARRVPRVVVGLLLCGVGFSFLVQAGLGLDPWNVFHQGVSERTGIPIGTVSILTGVVILLLWIPLRERPGIGTVLNTVLIGSTMDLLLPHLPEPGGRPAQWGYLVAGIAVAGPGIGLYIGGHLGPGPRDGVMTGLVRRGHPVALVRAGIELAALAAGWALGGTVGIGTVVFALSIGPVVGFWLPRLSMDPLPAKDHDLAGSLEADGLDDGDDPLHGVTAVD